MHRNISPSSIGDVSKPEASGFSASPTIGNSIKVAAKTKRMKSPMKMAHTQPSDSRAPCKKNRSQIATDVRPSKILAPTP